MIGVWIGEGEEGGEARGWEEEEGEEEEEEGRVVVMLVVLESVVEVEDMRAMGGSCAGLVGRGGEANDCEEGRVGGGEGAMVERE